MAGVQRCHEADCVKCCKPINLHQLPHRKALPHPVCSRVTVRDHGQQNYKGRSKSCGLWSLPGRQLVEQKSVFPEPQPSTPKLSLEGVARAKTMGPSPALFSFEYSVFWPILLNLLISHITENSMQMSFLGRDDGSQQFLLTQCHLPWDSVVAYGMGSGRESYYPLLGLVSLWVSVSLRYPVP